MGEQDSRDDALFLLKASIAMTIHDRGKIDDEHHSAIAQDGGSADQVGSHALVIQRLDDELFFSVQTVHDQPQFSLTHGNDQHKNFGGAGLNSKPRRTSQPAHGKNAVAQLQDFEVMYQIGR